MEWWEATRVARYRNDIIRQVERAASFFTSGSNEQEMGITNEPDIRRRAYQSGMEEESAMRT
jgi:hypothetical protein